MNWTHAVATLLVALCVAHGFAESPSTGTHETADDAGTVCLPAWNGYGGDSAHRRWSVGSLSSAAYAATSLALPMPPGVEWMFGHTMDCNGVLYAVGLISNYSLLWVFAVDVNANALKWATPWSSLSIYAANADAINTLLVAPGILAAVARDANAIGANATLLALNTTNGHVLWGEANVSDAATRFGMNTMPMFDAVGEGDTSTANALVVLQSNAAGLWQLAWLDPATGKPVKAVSKLGIQPCLIRCHARLTLNPNDAAQVTVSWYNLSTHGLVLKVFSCSTSGHAKLLWNKVFTGANVPNFRRIGQHTARPARHRWCPHCRRRHHHDRAGLWHGRHALGDVHAHHLLFCGFGGVCGLRHDGVLWHDVSERCIHGSHAATGNTHHRRQRCLHRHLARHVPCPVGCTNCRD